MSNAVLEIAKPLGVKDSPGGAIGSTNAPPKAHAQETRTQAQRLAAMQAGVPKWLGAGADTAASEKNEPDEVSLYRSLGRAVSGLRWMTGGMLFLLTLVQPKMGKIGLLNWQMVALFLVCNAVAAVIFSRLPGRRALYLRVIVDLPAASAVYFCSSTPGAPQFDLIFLAVLCAAISMPLHRSLIYTAVAIGLTAIIEPTLPSWQPTNEYVRELGARMLLLAMAGTGTAIVAWRLNIEHQHSHSARKEAARLEELERLRDDFISSITHDLRTPFTAVRAGLGMVEMSLGERLKPEEMHLLANVRRNSDRLGILINDLLAFAQFDSGSIHLDMQPLDLGDIVANAATTLQPLIEEKRQKLIVNVDSVLPNRGDKRKLEQVIVNILDNAHRHTPPGTTIAITGYRTLGEVRIVIQDDGPGIPPQECEAIFERFHRVDLKEGGWGLGLTIAQAITETHGGRIRVASELGQGAAFTIALPSYDTDILEQGEAK